MALPQPNPARIEVPAPFFQDNSLVRGDQLRDNNAAIWENLEYLDDEIIAEAGLREAADETLQDNIDAEALTRSNADSTLQNNIDAKQATLVSGTNIKSINGNSLLGAGDLTVTTDVAAAINAAATKAVPVGADKLGLVDTEASNVLKGLTISDLWSYISGLVSALPGVAKAWVNFDGTSAANVNATYARSGTTVTVTYNDHGYLVGHVIYASITSGSGTSGLYTITGVTQNTFTYTEGASGATSGNITLLRRTIRSSYNVHSVTYMNATARFAVNFAVALTSDEYVVGNCIQQDISGQYSGAYIGFIPRISGATNRYRAYVMTGQETPGVGSYAVECVQSSFIFNG